MLLTSKDLLAHITNINSLSNQGASEIFLGRSNCLLTSLHHEHQVQEVEVVWLEMHDDDLSSSQNLTTSCDDRVRLPLHQRIIHCALYSFWQTVAILDHAQPFGTLYTMPNIHNTIEFLMIYGTPLEIVTSSFPKMIRINKNIEWIEFDCT